MGSTPALVFFGAFACGDLALLVSSLPARLGRARWLLWLAPLGFGAALVARTLAEGSGLARWSLALGLPLFAFVAAFSFLLTSFTSEKRPAQILFAAHTAAAIALGVLALLGLEAEGQLASDVPGVERSRWSS